MNTNVFQDPTTSQTQKIGFNTISAQTGLEPSPMLSPLLKPDHLTFESPIERRSSVNISLTNTSDNHSMISKPSVLTLDMAVFSDILVNRNVHSIFNTISGDSNNDEWFFSNVNNSFEGPFSSFDMDEKFKAKILNENTWIKNAMYAEPMPLTRFVGKYYKRLVAAKQLSCNKSTTISRRSVNVLKDSFNRSRANPKDVKNVNREDRVTSTLTRPNLYFLKENDQENSSDDEEDVVVSRTRSYTMVS